MKHQPGKHQLLVSLCCISLMVCLWLGNVTYNTKQIQIGEVAKAQNGTLSQWVRDGVEKYQAGEFLDAIEDWKKALSIEKNNSNPRNKAIILENLARAYQQVGQTENAIEHWENVVLMHRQLKDITKLGRALTELAQVYSSYGQPKKAIELLCNPDKSNQCQTGTSVQIAKQNIDIEGEVAALGSLGDAYQLFEGCEEEGKCRAIQRLEDSLNKIKQKNKNINNKNYEISVLNSLGNIYTNRASLRYRRAFSLEKQGESTEKKCEDIKDKNKITDKLLEKRCQAQEDDNNALAKLKKSYELAQQIDEKNAEIRILLIAIPIYYRTKQYVQAKEVWKQARELLNSLPKNSQTAYTYIDLADKLQPTVDDKGLAINVSQCSQALKNSLEYFSEAKTLLNKAKNIAHKIKDSRAESFALGKLGKLYECSNKYDAALTYTKQAREVIEQNSAAKDSLFLWEWQTARILKQQNKIDDAIIAYKNSRHTLEKVRQDILSENRNFQFDFRDEVEPIYRELLELQLNAEAGGNENKSNQEINQDLLGALETMDSLKIGELQNYFGSDCIITVLNQSSKDKPNNLSNKDKFKNQILSLIGNDKKTAILSSIILDNTTAIILTLPNGESKIEWIDQDKETLRQKIISYRQALEEDSNDEYKSLAQNFYEIIIQPFEDKQYLDSLSIETLVFVQDGIFQSIPMAALYDKNHQKFLVQKYAIATTPSLSLTDNKKNQINNLKILALGLDERREIEGKIFKKLEHVQEELGAILNRKQLMNKEFNRENLEKELSKRIYSVIHMATHGEVGVEPKDTFIVTGDIKEGKEKLSITELDNIIRNAIRRQNRIDLLAITACDSAVGDDRSALGLAGVAIQAGAKSTLASLWQIDDKGTAQLAKIFYKGLNDSTLTKGQALQKAQRELIENEEEQKQHPYYWAPFILVGNWL